MKRKLGVVALGLLVFIIGVVLWGFVIPDGAPSGKWPLDVAELRKQAHAVEGELPTEVRVEKVATFEFPSAAQIMGTGPGARPMATCAYQLVFPSRTAIVDTAMDETTARASTPVKEYSQAAWGRLVAALDVADFVVVTHEHFDHIGGALVSAKGWARTLVNPQQLEHPELVKPLTYPASKPTTVVDYQGLKAVAPGVVLIRSPGHTPGSQLVYVQRADGVELLFLGDVAWQMQNVDTVTERARLVTTLMKEDRAGVLQQLQMLHDLKAAEPKILQVPGHDPAVIAALVSQGVLVEGFK